MWFLAVILLVALLIPVAAILADSPLGRSIARRLEGQGDGAGGDIKELQRRMEVLESDLDELTRSVAGIRDEIQFVQRLLEDPKKKSS